MDPAELIPRLAYHGKIPVEAIHDARNNWSSAAPAFVQAIEQFPSGDRSAVASLWIIFHLLGEMSETSAYRPLARLLRCPRGRGSRLKVRVLIVRLLGRDRGW